MEKTIEIPEGYEARIEGNKVILEPKESEEERIPRLLHKLLCAEVAAGQFEKHGLTVDDALYWLERQKEQQPAEWSEEDKQFIEHCAELLDKQGAPLCASRLKSLKNRGNSQKTPSNSSWKPSEVQMCALKYASTYVPDDEGTLAELYEQLKKL